MKINSLYPVIGTEKINECREFYVSRAGMEVTFESDWYVSLATAERRFELALLDPSHESVPEGFRFSTSGLLVNFEVQDVDAVYEEWKKDGLPVHKEIRSEPWGQRHFISEDPAGNLVDVIQLIAPSEEYANMYDAQTASELGAS